jgi:hypothetical protein
LAALVATSLGDVPAFGADETPDDAKDTCIAAAERGQAQRDDGKYRAAREAFVACSQDACPRVIQQSCTKWLHDLEESTPTIVLGAKDEHGTDLTDVTVTLDGAPFATLLDGKPIALDSGPHVLTFQREGGQPVEQKLLVRAGERARVVSVTLPSAGGEPSSTGPTEAEKVPPPEPLLSPRHVTASAIALGALVAGGTGLAFVLQSSSNSNTANALRGQPGLQSPSACTANPSSAMCTSLGDAVSSQHTDMNVATGLFVTAGVLLAGAVTTWFLWPKAQPTETPATEPQPAAPQASGSIVPLLGGAAVLVSGRF